MALINTRERPGGWSWSGLGDAVAHRQLVPYVRRELTPMIEHFYPFEVAIPLQKLHQRLEFHMEKASGMNMKKTNAAWCAEIFRSGNTFQLLIADVGSRQTILRSPVGLADASSVINLLRSAI